MTDPAARLDDLVLRVRHVQRRPGYRRRLLEGVPHITGFAALRVLRAIERAVAGGAPPSIREVSEDLGIEHSTASRAVNDVVAHGLVVKTACADDQRRARLDLTDRGRAELAQATANRRAILADVLDGWSDADVARLAGLLEHLVDGFDAVEGRAHG